MKLELSESETYCLFGVLSDIIEDVKLYDKYIENTIFDIMSELQPYIIVKK